MVSPPPLAIDWSIGLYVCRLQEDLHTVMALTCLPILVFTLYCQERKK